jgi:Polyketide cyclase / dehydrase and lipid transport
MDIHASLDAPCPPDELFGWVDDLRRYPRWLSIVTRADSDGEDGWVVDLRGRVGPLARSKRLRMTRTALEPDHLVVFERAERDGRDHSPWVLRAEVESVNGGSRLEMGLHYGGGLWASVLERMLRDEIDQSRARLLDLVSGRTR